MGALLAWVLSLITGNCSQVDRLWSIVPFVYCWHFCVHAYLQDSEWDVRLLVISGLTTCWGFRLTYNFYRKGGYNMKDEDYRWPALRKIINNRILFQLFNISFIAFYQNFLLYAITLPTYYVYQFRGEQWNVVDWIATVLFLFFLSIETLADRQQWDFQTGKHRLLKLGDKKALNNGPYWVGFNHTGLFRYSRHPNFWSEINMWWCILVHSLILLLFKSINCRHNTVDFIIPRINWFYR